MPARRAFLKLAAAFSVAQLASRDVAAEPAARVEPWAAKLLAAARSQIGVTTSYDPAYAALTYPGGDVPRERGVCTDVVIRACRDAYGMDLQRVVHEDMRAAFSAYPKSWELKRTDRNIDHRRVPNLETFFRRKNWALPVSQNPADWRPGDLFSQRLPGGQPHIGIVSDKMNRDGTRPLVIHNIGAGAREEDILFTFNRVGHFRVIA